MTDWLTLLADLRVATLAREGLDARAVTAAEIKEATDAAERGEEWAREWVESPAWDVAHEIVGWRDYAPLHRWMVLTAPRKPGPAAAEILRDAALLAAEYEAAGRSTQRCAVRLGVSKPTVIDWMGRHGIARQATGRPRVHTTDALPATAGDRRAA